MFQQSYDILLLILMVLLLVQAVLTSATVVHCASYKSQLRMGAPESRNNMHRHYCEVKQVELWRQISFFLYWCKCDVNVLNPSILYNESDI